ncbi:MAG: class I SAM-dependent methyltransferase [Chloroflexi bacterium]|nr:class I SAM-dependent methyltransferase [Chloroflexota bacterium]
MPEHAFDIAAQTYDTDFTDTGIGRYLRGRVWQRLDHLFQPGDTVLEIGCGTGEDAIHLARRGVYIIATDASPEMLNQTEQKAREHRVSELIEVRQLDLSDLPQWDLQVGGAYSNFGAINCTNDWAGLAEFLASVVRPSGSVGLGVMPPFCAWETLWHGLHGDFKTATRRWKGHSWAVLGDGSALDIYYPSVKKIVKDFAPLFTRDYVTGMGTFLPPSDVYGAVENRDKLRRLLTTLEQWFARRLAFCADHYWIEFKLLPQDRESA